MFPLQNKQSITVILACLAEGEPISRSDALLLLEQTDPARRREIRKAADLLRENVSANRVGLVRQIPLFYSNICELQPALYCYACTASDPRAYTITVDHIDALLEAGSQQADGVLIQGGLHASLRIWGLNEIEPLKVYGALVAYCRDQQPGLTIEAYHPEVIDLLTIVSDRSTDYVLDYLRDCGLDALSGHGAGLLVDGQRARISPRKSPVKRWRQIVSAAYARNIAMNAVFGFGFGETPEHCIEHLALLKAFIAEHPAAFKRLVVMPLARVAGNAALVEGVSYETACHYLAVSRLFLGDAIGRIQTFWGRDATTLDNPEVALAEASEALDCGADHFGSTASPNWQRFLMGLPPLDEDWGAAMRAAIAQAGRDPVT